MIHTEILSPYDRCTHPTRSTHNDQPEDLPKQDGESPGKQLASSFIAVNKKFIAPKLVAGKRICGGWAPRRELPTNQEVLDELARISEPGTILNKPDFPNDIELGWIEAKGKLPERAEKIVSQRISPGMN
jgi:hypothetical protein